MPATPASEPRPPPLSRGARLTSALEEVAVHILYGGVDGGPGGDTSRSDIGVILRIYILKSFPGDSRVEFWEVTNRTNIKT